MTLNKANTWLCNILSQFFNKTEIRLKCIKEIISIKENIFSIKYQSKPYEYVTNFKLFYVLIKLLRQNGNLFVRTLFIYWYMFIFPYSQSDKSRMELWSFTQSFCFNRWSVLKSICKANDKSNNIVFLMGLVIWGLYFAEGIFDGIQTKMLDFDNRKEVSFCSSRDLRHNIFLWNDDLWSNCLTFPLFYSMVGVWTDFMDYKCKYIIFIS